MISPVPPTGSIHSCLISPVKHYSGASAVAWYLQSETSIELSFPRFDKSKGSFFWSVKSEWDSLCESVCKTFDLVECDNSFRLQTFEEINLSSPLIGVHVGQLSVLVECL